MNEWEKGVDWQVSHVMEGRVNTFYFVHVVEMWKFKKKQWYRSVNLKDVFITHMEDRLEEEVQNKE